MSRVVLTGATGFIGMPCLRQLLAAGHEVHAVVPPGVEPTDVTGATWHVVDLLDAEQVHSLLAVVQPTHLLHLAWFVAPGDYWASTENIRWLQAGLELMREFADAGGQRAVMAGTCAEYAPSSELLVEEVSPLRPATLYGAAKTSLHIGAAAYFAERRVSFAWGHIFYLYGPREHPSRLVPSAIRSMLTGVPLQIARPNDVRDFLHVEDVASAFVALLGSGVEGDVNIASGEPVTVGEIVAEIARACDGSDLATYSSEPQEPAITVGDPTRLVREVGHVRRWNLCDGVRDTVEWWTRELDDRRDR